MFWVSCLLNFSLAYLVTLYQLISLMHGGKNVTEKSMVL